MEELLKDLDSFTKEIESLLSNNRTLKNKYYDKLHKLNLMPLVTELYSSLIKAKIYCQDLSKDLRVIMEEDI